MNESSDQFVVFSLIVLCKRVNDDMAKVKSLMTFEEAMKILNLIRLEIIAGNASYKDFSRIEQLTQQRMNLLAKKRGL